MGIDYEIVWNIIENDLDELKKEIINARDSLADSGGRGLTFVGIRAKPTYQQAITYFVSKSFTARLAGNALHNNLRMQ